MVENWQCGAELLYSWEPSQSVIYPPTPNMSARVRVNRCYEAEKRSCGVRIIYRLCNGAARRTWLLCMRLSLLLRVKWLIRFPLRASRTHVRRCQFGVLTRWKLLIQIYASKMDCSFKMSKPASMPQPARRKIQIILPLKSKQRWMKHFCCETNTEKFNKIFLPLGNSSIAIGF